MHLATHVLYQERRMNIRNPLLICVAAASLAMAGCATSPGYGSSGYGSSGYGTASCYDCGTVTRIEQVGQPSSGVTGAVLGGIVGAAIPAIGIPLVGVGLVALTGAAVGAWSSALMGSEVPSPVRRQFEAEIEAGRVLVVVDAPRDEAPRVSAALREAGAIELPFEQLTALS